MPRGRFPPDGRATFRGDRRSEVESQVRRTRVRGGARRLVLLDSGLYRPAPIGSHRAAASALSSGRVLKAIAAPGAAL